MILTPRLSGEGNELNLPSVMIAGRNRYYHHLRNGLCTDDMMLIKKQSICGQISYSGTLCRLDETCHAQYGQ